MAESEVNIDPAQENELEDFLNNACNVMCDIAAQQAPHTMFILGGEDADSGSFGIVLVAVGEDGKRVWSTVQAAFDVPEVPVGDTTDPED